MTKKFLKFGLPTLAVMLVVSLLFVWSSFSVSVSARSELVSVSLGQRSFAATSPVTQLIIGGCDDALSTTDEYNTLQGGLLWTATANQMYQLVSTAGTINKFYLELSTAPNSGSYTITLMLNGSATDLAVTISAGGNAYGSDTVHSVTVAAGDYIYLRCTDLSASGTPTARWSCEFTGDNNGESLILAHSLAYNNGTNYAPISHSFRSSSINSAQHYQIIPTSGSIKNLYVLLSTDPGDSPSDYKFTLYVNGSTSTLTCTIVADATIGNDTAHSVSVVAGDYVYLAIIPENTPSANLVDVSYGFTFLASTDGESIILGQSSDTPTNTQTEYNYLNSTLYSNKWSTTEKFQSAHSGFTLKDFYVKQSDTSGSGKQWDYTIRGGGGSTALTVSIAGASDTTGNDTAHTYDLVDYDDLAIMAVPTSTPTARRVYWGVVCYKAPAATFDISNDPSSKAFGVVNPSSTYYAKGSAPANPVESGDCTFTVTNAGTACDLDMKVSDFTGGVGWNITSSAPSTDEARITAYYEGQDPASGLVLANTDAEFYDGLAVSATLNWDFKQETASSFSDGVGKTATITITAVAED
jgi:hypothetical protein